MQYTREVEEMVCVAKGPNHGPAPIPEEGKWVQAKEIKDISGYTHGIGWCAPQQGACKLSLNVKNGIIEEALVETIGCSGMTHSAAMASEILPGKTILEALNTDLVCDAINTAMRELFLQIVYGRTQSAFSDDGLRIGAGLEDLGKGLRSMVGTMYGTRANAQTVVREGGLGAAVDDLQKQLAHGGVDRVADQIGVQRLKNGLAGQNLAGHRGGMGHAGAADDLHESLLNDAVLDVQAQLAGALLGRAAADTVGVAGDIFDFPGLNPFSFFRNRSGAMVRAFGNTNHVFNFLCVLHVTQSSYFEMGSLVFLCQSILYHTFLPIKRGEESKISGYCGGNGDKPSLIANH